MFNFDIFPEDSYDPSSGEYSSNFDFEPLPVADVPLIESGLVYARIFDVGEETEGEGIAFRLADLAASGVFELFYDPNNPEGYPLLPDDFSHSDKHKTRGPFLHDQLTRFFDRTGLASISEVFYDDELDAFWIEIDTP